MTVWVAWSAAKPSMEGLVCAKIVLEMEVFNLNELIEFVDFICIGTTHFECPYYIEHGSRNNQQTYPSHGCCSGCKTL